MPGSFLTTSARRPARARFGRVCLAAVAVCLFAGGLSACDDSIDTPDSLRGTYTIWGALDPTADVQSIRVVPITDTIGLGSAAPLPVTVVSVNLATGVETAWRDSVITYANGAIGHIYRAPFRPDYESRQRFVVRRAEGGEVSAIIVVPPLVQPIVRTPQTTGGVRVPVLWPGAPQLNRIRVRYTIEDEFCDRQTVDRGFVGESGPVEFGWQTTLDLSTEAASIQAAGVRYGLRRIEFVAEVASEDWRPPGGIFDSDVLAQPGTLGNVSGGFGFVGAAYPIVAPYVPALRDVQAAGFLNTASSCP